MYRILLIDDHAVVRRGLREILEEGFSEASVGEAATGKEGLEKLREQSWDAVVLDIALPDINGLEVLKQIKADWPTTPVLMLSVYSGRGWLSKQGERAREDGRGRGADPLG
jgi:DNA-binding NarL/FixJ family response regulator